MCEAIDQMRNQIIEANRKAEDAMRETAYANRKADAYKAYLRKLGVPEEELEAIE
ncbi:MAG: hypothetical protein IKE28_00250 [Solobacterium sp.]|nr:hypothetical protein [Solobacterium sp.]